MSSPIPLLGRQPKMEYEIQSFAGDDAPIYAPFFYVDGKPSGFLELATPPTIPGLPPPAPGVPFTSPNRAFIRAYLASKMPQARERIAHLTTVAAEA